jgi:riboflavin kinase/FMN adenylyltransferase
MPVSRPEVHRIAVDRAERLPDSIRNAVVAIGNFDGVHRGHQALVAEAASIAASIGSRPVVLTFEPHPRAILQPDGAVSRLTPAGAKRLLLRLAGAEGVVEAAFDRNLMALGPDEFAASILTERLAARAVVVGEGFRFGNKRAGDTERLTTLGRQHGFAVEVLPTVTDADGHPVSSGRVREALAAGDLDAAAANLGYRWFAAGTVVPGDSRGRTLGYPTANINLPAPIGLAYGIYAVTARWPGADPMQGVASFGIRPMFGGAGPVLEVHLFDFEGDVYGRELMVVFQARLRPERRFASTDALIRQMDEDAALSREVLAAAGPGTRIDKELSTAEIERVAEA